VKKKQNAVRTASIADIVSEAFGELQSLGEEMREWADNIEEKFSDTQKFQTVSDAAEALENLSEPDIPEAMNGIQITVTDLPQRRRGHSRSAP
jgi:hypothetical protein